MSAPGIAVAQIMSLQAERMLLAAAVVLTLIGVYLRWNATHYQMSIEERAKDGRISEEQARRRILFSLWCGPLVMMAGFALAAVALLLN